MRKKQVLLLLFNVLVTTLTAQTTDLNKHLKSLAKGNSSYLSKEATDSYANDSEVISLYLQNLPVLIFSVIHTSGTVK